MAERVPGHLLGRHIMPPCPVCEADALHANRESSMALMSERVWAFVPCVREVLTICLNCGNTIRERRLE
jgi:hypothetical protein